METKICFRCKQTKDVSEFSKTKNGLHSWCKQCTSEYKRTYQKKHKEEILEYKKTYQKKHKKKIVEYSKIYRKAHTKEAAKYQKKYQRERCKTDTRFRTKKNFGSMISGRLKRRGSSKKGKSTFSFLKYTVEELMAHLENLFKPGMTWENYGAWHIDHVKPDSKFNYTNIEDEEFQKCWALENLQPLWAKENRKKSNKFNQNSMPSEDQILIQKVISGQLSADEALLDAGLEAEKYNGAVSQELFDSLDKLGLSADVRASWLQGHTNGTTFAETQLEDIDSLENKLNNKDMIEENVVPSLEEAVVAEIAEESAEAPVVVEEVVEAPIEVLEPLAEEVVAPEADALEEEMAPFVEAPVLPMEVAPVLEEVVEEPVVAPAAEELVVLAPLEEPAPAVEPTVLAPAESLSPEVTESVVMTPVLTTEVTTDV